MKKVNKNEKGLVVGSGKPVTPKHTISSSVRSETIDYKKQGKINKVKIFNCKYCGKETKSYYPNAKYCSRECRRKDIGLKYKECPVCGKKFKPTWHGQIHCNIYCYSRSEKLKNEAKNSLLIKYNSYAKWREGTKSESFKNSGQFKKGAHPWNHDKDMEFNKLCNKIRRMPEYFEWRKDIMKRDNLTSKGTNVHHLKPFREIILENEILSIEDARNCEELWDISKGVALKKGEHKIISDVERLKSLTDGFLIALKQAIEDKEDNRVKVNYKEIENEL